MTTGFDFEFTSDQFAEFLGHKSDAEQWYSALCKYLPDYDINTRSRVSAFLAQTHHESAGYRFLSENLNYRWQSLMRVWPRHFPTEAIAKSYAHDPERIANRAYANRMGNGNEASGDGWRYRGQGLIQLTGRDNQARFAADAGMSLADVPDYLGTYSGAVHSACWFWQENNLNRWVDSNDFDGLSDAINLGRKTAEHGDAHGFQDRLNQYHRAMAILGGDIDESPVLRRGSYGPAVKLMQQALGITADGIFGPGTERALKAWQTSQGLVADGVLGPVSHARLLGDS